jgi:hypothetical protein
MELLCTGFGAYYFCEDGKYYGSGFYRSCEGFVYMIWYVMIWYMICYDVIWYDVVCYDMIWCDMIWYDTRVLKLVFLIKDARKIV